MEYKVARVGGALSLQSGILRADQDLSLPDLERET